MQKVFQAIANLAKQHTCVILPAFGGFVRNRKSAFFDAERGCFVPASYEILFNQQLKHNDGLLVQELTVTNSVSVDCAQKMIDEAVAEINKNLSDNSVCSVSGFGCFAMKNGIITFTQKAEIVGCPETFGLSEFYMPRLSEQETSGIGKKTVAGVGMAAALAAFAFLSPFSNEDFSEQVASFLPSVSSVDVATPSAIEELACQTQLREPELVVEEPEVHGYNIILAKFDTEAQANYFIKKHQPHMSDSLRAMPLADVYVISCATTDNLAMATKMLDHVHANSVYKKAFLLYK